MEGLQPLGHPPDRGRGLRADLGHPVSPEVGVDAGHLVPALGQGQGQRPAQIAIDSGNEHPHGSASVILDVPVDDRPPRPLGAQNHLDRLPEHALAPAGPGDEVGHGLDLGRRVADGDGEAGSLQRGHVEEIVADVGGLGGGHAELGAERLQRLALAPGAQHDRVHAELVTPHLGDRALLPGHEGGTQSSPPGQLDGDAVAGVEALELVAALAQPHAAIGEDPVHVGDEQTDPAGSTRHARGRLHAGNPKAPRGLARGLLAGRLAQGGQRQDHAREEPEGLHDPDDDEGIRPDGVEQQTDRPGQEPDHQAPVVGLGEMA